MCIRDSQAFTVKKQNKSIKNQKNEGISLDGILSTFDSYPTQKKDGYWIHFSSRS